jgi:hypothetical protein
MGNAPTGESIDARAVNVDRLADGEIVARSRQENRPVADPLPGTDSERAVSVVVFVRA